MSGLEIPAADLADVRDLVMRWGWNATSFQMLEPGHHYFRAHGGVIAYRDTGDVWVAAGAPAVAPPQLASITADFIDAAQAARRRACFALVEHRFLTHTGLHSVQIGSQPVWDPLAWGATLAQSRGLREQLRRARAKDVVVRQLSADALSESGTRRALDGLTEAWLQTRPIAPLDFLVRVELYSNPSLRRIFVAEQDGRLVAAAALVPVPARHGWLLEDLLRTHDAPNGTAELLVDAAARSLAADGFRWWTMGLVALSGDVPPFLRALGRVGTPFYNFAGLAAFRRRLRPSHWLPVYVAYPDRFGGTRALLATGRAIAGGSLRRFAVRTMQKRISGAAMRA